MSTDTTGSTGRVVPDPADVPASRINLPVFVPSAVIALAMTLWCVVAPDHAFSTMESWVGWVSTWFGWFYIALTTMVLLFVIYLGFSRYGSVRLGPEHSKPEFSTGAWAAMLFAAGIGTDLMFFAVYEPVTQYLAPPSTQAETVTAAREATVWTLFHYGISGWGMYALMGMALAYFAYRMNLPLAVRSALFPLIGKKVDGPIGHAVDTAAVIGTIFGVATSLGIGVVSLNVGLNVVFGIPQGLATQSALIVLAVAIATFSAVSGIEKGIKRISQLNVLLAILLAVYVLVTGRTAYLLNALVLNVGDYARLFPDMTMQTFAYEDTGDWMSFWTLFFWAWWIAWAAFVGLFLARISRGRTIKQFVAGTMIIPFSYILMWVSIFGNAAIGEIRTGNADFAEAAAEAIDPSEGLWALLQEYPAFPVVASLAILVGLLFYVTSADSGALVMGNLTSRLRSVNDDSSAGLRIFWAVTTGALTLAILAAGSIYALQYATVIVGLPFAFVMLAVMWGLYKALSLEGHMADSRRSALPGALSGRSSAADPRRHVPWQSRMRRVMTFPTRARVEEFVATVVVPALEEVSVELREQGVAAEVASLVDETGEPAVELVADVGAALAFHYKVQRRTAPIPAYGGWAPRGNDVYCRLEVHLRDGGQEYDVMGYSHTQLIDDVLDQYERHLEFLRRADDAGL
ncbi:High-affinity choline transport protein [Nocardioides dokdonensis FR1436]|uniref:High-affinity choline transport protein n=1 Tax=Nocardioides dokdonensis FR1436 TaxID=1300347 RepID=A0A1A9GGI3_9ACTN|nr:choline BCCT transporter BetT [Nocardioides dokdonensis]ANH36733.1 High-affinity choline transport protein [Nocardioides dokdonensis FR1436]